MAIDPRKHIVRDPNICGGAPIIRGTRVTLRTVLASLAEGASVQEILADFPTLTESDVRLGKPAGELKIKLDENVPVGVAAALAMPSMTSRPSKVRDSQAKTTIGFGEHARPKAVF